MKRLNLVLIGLAILVLACESYLALGQDSLNVTRLSQISTGGTIYTGCTDVAVSGGYAYVANGYVGFRIVNISNPSSPFTVSVLESLGDVNGVAVSGNYAYITSGELRVIDITNPQQPFVRSNCNFPNPSCDVAISGNYAYVADNWCGLRVVNISNPDSIYEIAACDTLFNVQGVVVSGNYAYLAAYVAGLRIIDITSPENPVEIGSCSTAQGHDVAVSGNYAYTVGNWWLDVINISNPANPILVSHYGVGPGTAFGVAISGHYAYVAHQYAGLYVINVIVPAAPYTIGYYDTDGNAQGVTVSGGYAYLADFNYFGIYQFIPPPYLDVTLTPINPPIVIPANGGSFNFNASVRRHVPPQEPFWVWARDRYPNGTYTSNLLGPVNINPPVGVNVTRQRTQVVPSSWPAGVHYYIGYAAQTVGYPAVDADSFSWTKSATADGGQWVTEASCTGELFPGEETRAGQALPLLSRLVAISPNPFNPTTTINFELPKALLVTLRVYNTSGRLVATLANGYREAGAHEMTFDGSKLASGVYVVRMQAGEFTAVQKMVLLK